MARRISGGEIARLAALGELGMLDTPPEERFDRVVRLAQQLFDVPAAFVSLVDTDRLFYKAEVGLGKTEAPRAGSFCTVVVEDDEGLVVPDTQDDPRFSASPYVTDDPNIRFYAGQPLAAAGGHRVGTLCVYDTKPREFSDAESRLLRDLARWVEKELVVEDELRRAGEVQASLLPRSEPRVDGFEIAGACVPAQQVGGDFYDWQTVPDGDVVLTLADVMGKGMGSAIIAATVRAVLRSSSRRGTVEEALADAELALESDLSAAGSFVTALHARLDPTTAVVHYADAGHGLTLLRRAVGDHERLAPTGPPLGMAFGNERVGAEVTLEPGDMLLSVSDGVLDMLDGSLESLAVLEGVLTGATGAHDAVERVVDLTRRQSRRPDDVTVLALARAG
ncbi:SpoIIE family protein phosphatase [Actinotalea sp. BY-33]|uniref:SpoIIE family protein phosphatase n=1 Tax=Actinotalea soli TaxID=2819234 RepID=A0A939LWJ0_9CELL|nr:GAF domain-containing SpoIIE family protein phosphatase [Actinotalea soli]MBO1753469.1 SpoIIE family protein phosphatase [Actinotalea soli]